MAVLNTCQVFELIIKKKASLIVPFSIRRNQFINLYSDLTICPRYSLSIEL